jgi:glucokinase
MHTAIECISPSEGAPPFFAGIDLGGTNIKVGLVDDLGRPLAKVSVPTNVKKGPEDGARRMGETVRRVIQQVGLQLEDVVYAGLGSPGTMDVPAGMLIEPPNLPGWVNFPIRDRVSQHCGLPVAFANDANAAAYGEFWVGSGRTMHSMIMLTLGTGVGGGIILGDVSVDGEHSHGSECGHVIIDYRDDARMCPCGQPGHLEAYASAKAIVKRAHEAIDHRHKTSLAGRLEHGDELTALMIAQDAEAGDAFALELILETAVFLGVGITSLIHTIDPDGVVLGGAMTFGGHDNPIGKQFLDRVRAEVHRRVFATLIDRVSIDYATLGGGAGFIGAAGIARLAYHKQQGLSTGRRAE